MRIAPGLLLLCSGVLLGACTSDPAAGDTDAGVTESGTDGTGSASASASASAGTMTSASSSSETDSGEPDLCGNGELDPDEQCDDGNDDDTDACVNCRNARCGDGAVQAGVEECDDGNLVDTDACRANCTEAFCGDGVVQVGVEQCDDGNQIDDDGCSNDCMIIGCGNGVLEDDEECDDGNQNDNDECTNACTNAICGDGSVQMGVEECDDGNDDDTDSCTNACTDAACGDGFVRAGVEECDDGNLLPYDGCSDDCNDEPFAYSFGAATCPSGASQYFREDEVDCTSADDALAACIACMGPGNGCDNGITGCTDSMVAIDADACPNAVAFVYVSGTVCEASDVTDCDDNPIAADWCTPVE
jgi:cysteine-rich repeat protein